MHVHVEGKEEPGVPANNPHFESTLKSQEYAMLHNISHQTYFLPCGQVKEPIEGATLVSQDQSEVISELWQLSSV